MFSGVLSIFRTVLFAFLACSKCAKEFLAFFGTTFAKSFNRNYHNAPGRLSREAVRFRSPKAAEEHPSDPSCLCAPLPPDLAADAHIEEHLRVRHGDRGASVWLPRATGRRVKFWLADGPVHAGSKGALAFGWSAPCRLHQEGRRARAVSRAEKPLVGSN